MSKWKKEEGGRKIMMSCPDFLLGTPRFPTAGSIGASHRGLVMELQQYCGYMKVYTMTTSFLSWPMPPCMGADSNSICSTQWCYQMLSAFQSNKFKLYKTLVLSILMYGCESWTLTADLERRIQAFEHKCFRKLLRLSYTEHKTNEFVWQQVTTYAGSQELL